MKIGICALCHQRQPLDGRSPAMPYFLQNAAFDADALRIRRSAAVRTTLGQQHPIDLRHQLCRACASFRVGRLDDYARQLLRPTQTETSWSVERVIDAEGTDAYLINRIDYRRFKLFLLSVLWRAHLSNHAFFAGIHIPEHAEALRTMIISRSAGLECDYRVSIFAFSDQAGGLLPLTAAPTLHWTGPLAKACLLIGGLLFTFDLTPSLAPPIFNVYFLNPDGPFQIPVVRGLMAQAILSTIGMQADFMLQ